MSRPRVPRVSKLPSPTITLVSLIIKITSHGRKDSGRRIHLERCKSCRSYVYSCPRGTPQHGFLPAPSSATSRRHPKTATAKQKAQLTPSYARSRNRCAARWIPFWLLHLPRGRRRRVPESPAPVRTHIPRLLRGPLADTQVPDLSSMASHLCFVKRPLLTAFESKSSRSRLTSEPVIALTVEIPEPQPQPQLQPQPVMEPRPVMLPGYSARRSI